MRLRAVFMACSISGALPLAEIGRTNNKQASTYNKNKKIYQLDLKQALTVKGQTKSQPPSTIPISFPIS